MSMFYEYEAKKLFKDNSIPTPRIKLYDGLDSVKEFAKEIDKDSMMAKAQTLAGGRGKAGLIKKVTVDEAEKYIKSITGKEHKGSTVNKVLLEEPVTIKQEYYLTVMMDNAQGSYMVLASPMGGVDIEEVADKHPNKIFKKYFGVNEEPLPYKFMQLGKQMGFERKTLLRFTHVLSQMIKMSKDKDLTLVEINPLILTEDDKIIAADAKVVVDGNAYYRHPDIAKLQSQRDQYTDLEYEAKQAGISYVQLDGEVGIIACGAGLSMATCDLLEFYGSSPANFLDVGGGADEKKVDKALEILSSQDIKGIFVNVFGGITRGDQVAEGIISATKRLDIEIPMVIRLIGTNDQQGIALLEENGYNAYGEMEPAIKKIVTLTKGGN